MRRFVILGVVLGLGAIFVRALGPKLHERMAVACERMLDRMPDEFPPKKMLRGIEETRADTARILAMLEGRAQPVTSTAPGLTPSAVASDVA